ANRVTVLAAVPLVSLTKPNVVAEGSPARPDDARYTVQYQDVADENTGGDPENLPLRSLNLRLLPSTESTAGYEVLPIARLEKSARAEAVPQIDETYIPPLLACDASPLLSAKVLQQIYDRIGKKLELLASQVVTRGIGFDSASQGDRLLFEQLRILNEAYTVLGGMALTPGVHPLPVYFELCRVVGQLAIFGAERRPPEIPRYDHDDLGGCFFRLKQYIDALLNIVVEPEYKERPFVGAGLRMQVSLEPVWLESVWQMFIGVRSPLDAEETIRLVTMPGDLDMKVGGSERVDAVFRLGLAGLKFTHSPRPPRALPQISGLVYFQIARDAASSEWQQVQKSLTLAVRINENRIAGDIQGRRTLTITTADGAPTTLEFTLYVVPNDAK
ncbi:MAG: type VI secretion system baseplate subunit TssK, partial [Planctomycetia bacterium]